MNCGYFREKLDHYTEGKLGNEDRLSFESHLQICPDCREVLNLQVLADRIITEEKNVVPDFYLTGKIMARIGSLEKEHDPLLIRIFKPALATVLLAAAIMGGVLIGSIPGKTADMAAPIEFVLMNDVEMESLNHLTSE